MLERLRRRIGKRSEDLMNVGAVGLANVVGETMPAVFVQLGDVSFVFRVHDVNDIAAEQDNVRDQMSERTMRWIRPYDGEDRSNRGRRDASHNNTEIETSPEAKCRSAGR
jgi:hypothetical protein